MSKGCAVLCDGTPGCGGKKVRVCPKCVDLVLEEVSGSYAEAPGVVEGVCEAMGRGLNVMCVEGSDAVSSTLGVFIEGKRGEVLWEFEASSPDGGDCGVEVVNLGASEGG